jgi:hypothetical protein
LRYYRRSKNRCDERQKSCALKRLKLTKGILAAPSEENSKRGVRNDSFIEYPRSAGGRAFEKPYVVRAMGFDRRSCGRRPQTHLTVVVTRRFTLKRLRTPTTVASSRAFPKTSDLTRATCSNRFRRPLPAPQPPSHPASGPASAGAYRDRPYIRDAPVQVSSAPRCRTS